jgi:hypothetical protein
MSAKHNNINTPWLLAAAIVLFGSSASQAGEMQVLFTDADGQPVPEAVIEIVSPTVPLPADWPLTGAMDQKDKEFIGPLLMVVKNSLVSFPNSDDIHHHVYSFSETKPFELPLYTGNSAAPVLFDNAGVVVIGCNIHDWMVGYIYVGETHLMAMSDAAGKAVLSDLPAGDYTFKVWHVRGRANELAQTYTATIGAEGSANVNVQLALTPDRRIRRAPTSGGVQY